MCTLEGCLVLWNYLILKKVQIWNTLVASNLVGATVYWETSSTSCQLTQVSRRGLELAEGLKAVPGLGVGGFAANLTFSSIPIVSETFLELEKGYIIYCCLIILYVCQMMVCQLEYHKKFWIVEHFCFEKKILHFPSFLYFMYWLRQPTGRRSWERLQHCSSPSQDLSPSTKLLSQAACSQAKSVYKMANQP